MHGCQVITSSPCVVRLLQNKNKPLEMHNRRAEAINCSQSDTTTEKPRKLHSLVISTGHRPALGQDLFYLRIHRHPSPGSRGLRATSFNDRG